MILFFKAWFHDLVQISNHFRTFVQLYERLQLGLHCNEKKRKEKKIEENHVARKTAIMLPLPCNDSRFTFCCVKFFFFCGNVKCPKLAYVYLRLIPTAPSTIVSHAYTWSEMVPKVIGKKNRT